MTVASDLPHVVSTWETGADFRRQVGELDGVRTFFHPVREAAELPAAAVPGALISVSLRFLDRDIEFHVHTRVVARITEAPSGLKLAFLPEERDRQELVLASAEGESVPYLRRKSVRTPCNLDVHVKLENGTSIDTKLSTISERGAHVALETLAPEQRVTLTIAFAERAVQVVGRVTAKIAGPQRGAGIEFIFASSKQRDDIAAAVTKFRATLK
jgi:hypothetical protein